MRGPTTPPLDPSNPRQTSPIPDRGTRMTGNHNQFLDTIQRRLESGEDVAQTMDSLFDWLFQQRRQLTQHAWEEFVLSAREHQLLKLVHQDPFTRQSFDKPRGYPGDAELLDYIYGENDTSGCSELGQKILAWNISVSEAQAVRNRRDFIADLIDNRANEVKYPHILSVAAGHLRESRKSEALSKGHFGRFVALDRDPLTFETVKNRLPDHSIEFVQGLVPRFPRIKKLDQFDLIYATGLYDYLDAPTATSFTKILFDKLKPNGWLLVTNFLKGSRSAGYMETYMDWYLIYRDLDQITAFLNEIPKDQIKDIELFRDETTTLGYLLVRRLHNTK